MHLLGECFLIALGTNRTMVTLIQSHAYEDCFKVFHPLFSNNCIRRKTANAVEWKGRRVIEFCMFKTAQMAEWIERPPLKR